MASSGKEAGDKLIAEAEKCLKTSLFKWNPDYETAANRFEKAALSYRNGRQHEKAKEAYIKAADAYYNSNGVYHSGKSYEQASNVCRDAKKLIEAGELMQKACERFSESGHPDVGAQVLVKAAGWLQHEEPEMAAKMYLMSSEYHVIEDRLRESGNACKDAVRMYCRTRPRKLDKIIETSKVARKALLDANMINVSHELVAVEIIALLLQGNSMQARETLQEAESVPQFGSSEEFIVLDELIEAVSGNDEETVSSCCTNGIFKAMDPEFSKLVRDLKTGEESLATTHKKDAATATTTTTTSTSTKVKETIAVKDPTILSGMRNDLFATKGNKTEKKEKVDDHLILPDNEPDIDSETEHPNIDIDIN